MEWEKLLSDKRVSAFFVEPEPREKNNRTEFERDYDRAIFSTPVRRMHDKAQVFPLEPNDSVRTRLTHSLEVSTVARDMARVIGSWLDKDKKEIDEKQAKAIESIAATCGLIHDLGNPPFGHAGEEAIAEWFKEKNKQGDFLVFSNAGNRKKQLRNDFLKFEGNAQTLRLVSKLQILSDLYGLNFTCATMSAACKYMASSDTIDKNYHEKKKVGYFASEELIIDLVRNETGTGESKNPITFIVEAVDDIVFSVVDLEDGVKKGVVDWKMLEKLLRDYSEGNNEILEACFERAEKLVAKDPLVKLKGKSRDEAMAQAFRVWAIGESVYAAIETFKEKYEDIMNGDYHNELFEDSKARSLIKACKEVGVNHVYCVEQVVKKEVMARRVIHDLMDIFWKGASKKQDERTRFEKGIYNLMSENYRTVFERITDLPAPLPKYSDVYNKSRGNEKLPENYCCMQLVTDYICGMTDTFACTLHRQLTNG
ncbi:MAG: dNTP triphosphohydrolase [Planctomycetes bacterium]|nr:dNTP triphosphohydrolase [Planctomycetota bacterium]